MSELRVCVVGAGPMGRLHARTVARAAERGQGCRLACVVDRHHARAEAVADEFGAGAFAELDAGLAAADAVVVAVPTSSHLETARRGLERGLDVLVEKPMAATLAEGERLARSAREQDRILQVGHVEWYNPGWRGALAEAGRPLRIEVERLNPRLERGLDIDVVADFMLHDLDWVTRAVGEEVVEIEARGARVVADDLDVAEATLRFRSGCLARLRASRVHDERRRRLRIEGERSTRSSDLLVSPSFEEEAAGGSCEPGPDPLSLQWSDFLSACRSRKAPDNDSAVGLAALELVERVRRCIYEGDANAGCAGREDDPLLGG